jgi:HSP20 family protein
MSVQSLPNNSNKSRAVVVPFFRDDWLVSDPFRDEFFSLFRHNSDGQDLSKQRSPLLTSDLVETDTEFKVYADLPGVAQSDVDIQIEGQALVMKAERKHTHETKTDKFHSMERSYGTVQRRFVLPKTADLGHAAAKFKDGVLTVTVPKLAQLPPTSTKLNIDCE